MKQNDAQVINLEQCYLAYRTAPLRGDVFVEIDEALLHALARKALKNRSRKAGIGGGLIVCRAKHVTHHHAHREGARQREGRGAQATRSEEVLVRGARRAPAARRRRRPEAARAQAGGVVRLRRGEREPEVIANGYCCGCGRDLQLYRVALSRYRCADCARDGDRKDRPMPNHPNRGRGNPARNPPPDRIRQAREASGLTQTEAAELLYTSCRVWQQWEAGARRMHPAFFELFNLKRPTRRP